MPLLPGTRLGPYEVLAPIGAGGMGEVYRARDARLGRDVAIKSLPAPAVIDPELIARFEREARILASLNHPHVATLFGVEEVNGARFLVMELLDGGTLAERLRQAPPPLAQALAIARQIADALDAAHDKGIVHRDLKPSNIALGPSGHVKVLDFGLAKALDADPESATMALAATQAGVVLGTAAYMSPEQARGGPIDKRSDIWSFGCVLYELLTGRHPFPGRTISDTIAAILGGDPDWTPIPPATPPRIAWLVRRCLEKDPRRRLHDIADARIELEEALSESSGSHRAAPDGVAPTAARRILAQSRLAWLVAGASLIALIYAMTVGRIGGTGVATPRPRPLTASVVLPDGLRLSLANPPGRLALSPDGLKLAVVASDALGRSMLWIRPLDSVVAQPLAGTEGASFPFWSPDSRFLAFLASGKLKKVDVEGGVPVTLCDALLPSTGAWSRDDVILFTPKGSSPLYRVSAAGGAPSQVTSLDQEAGDVQHWYPGFLPDGRHFLYFVVGSRTGGLTDPRAIYLGSLDPKEPARLLVKGGSNAKFASGHIVYLREGTLVAQRFDVDRLQLDGEAMPLVEQVQVAGVGNTGVAGAFSLSDDGVLVYQTGFMVRSQLAWFDRAGKELRKLGELADYADVSLSPDGTRAAVSMLDPSLGTRDLWLYDVARGLPERFTFDRGDDFAPVWARPDGDRVYFSSRRGGAINLYQKRSRGGGSEELLYEDALGKFASHVSPDGRHLVYIGGGGVIIRSDLWIFPLSGERKASPLLQSAFIETHGQFSPDGRWLAYMTNESGRFEVYVTPFPDAGEKWQVSTGGGGWPRWGRGGAEIVYLGLDNRFMSVPITASGARLEMGPAQPLFAIRPRPQSRLDGYQYDLSPDSQRFLVSTSAEEMMSAPITLVVNWPEMLQRTRR